MKASTLEWLLNDMTKEEIIGLKILLNSDHSSTGYAFALFETQEGVSKAIKLGKQQHFEILPWDAIKKNIKAEDYKLTFKELFPMYSS